jgi:cytoskeleton protein RodZ
MSEESGEDAALFESLVGSKLRDARESQGISLEDIAKSTRIPLRQLQNIENSDYEKLPAPTYSIGFVKAYALAVGLNAPETAAAFREEINFRSSGQAAGDYFEPTDPARVPPRSLAWIAAGIALLLIIGYALWRSGMFGLDGDDRARMAAGTDAPAASENADIGTDPAAAAPAPPPTEGTVMIEATDTVWLRIYELESGDRIYEAELQAGETYEIPSDAVRPAIRTGRADALRVTVAGREVDPIGPPLTVISDVSLLPADLARPRPATVETPPAN